VKGSIALDVTMETKPTTQHRHSKRVQWNIYHNPYLPIWGWEEWERNQQISQAVNSNDPQRSAKQPKEELTYAITYQPLQTKQPLCTSLPAWGSTTA